MSKRNDNKRTKQAISDAIQAANRRQRRNTRYVAFYPDRPSVLIPDDILQNIIEAAKRGRMTEAGKNLRLVPDTRYERANDAGMKAMKSVKKRDCLTLGELYRGYAK